MENKKLTLQQLKNDLLEELENEKEEIIKDKYPEDRIHVFLFIIVIC